MSKQNVARRVFHTCHTVTVKRRAVDTIHAAAQNKLWRQLSLGQSEKCAVVDEIVGAKHDIKFNSACSLHKAASCIDHMVKEAVNKKLHPNNFR